MYIICIIVHAPFRTPNVGILPLPKTDEKSLLLAILYFTESVHSKAPLQSSGPIMLFTKSKLCGLQEKMKKRKLYFPSLCTLWVACPTYVILVACFTSDIVDKVCKPWEVYSSVTAAKAAACFIVSVNYFLPLALMIFWYSRIVHALRTKVTTHRYSHSE